MATTRHSPLGACKALGNDPEKWLAHTLKHIGSAKPEDLRRLLPEEWTE
ncbi:MAG: transposase domain-containing protein [Bacteroidales bacterium]|nr:transposase domain-containing protein [Bacteroidales bacterium]